VFDIDIQLVNVIKSCTFIIQVEANIRERITTSTVQTPCRFTSLTG